MTLRVPINKFATANKGYRGAKVYVFTVDDDFVKTNTKATLYDGPTGTGTLANPVTLDSAGKFDTIPYVDVSVICTVNSMDFGEHDTGLTRVPGGWEGTWGPATVYQADDLVKDGSAGTDTGNVYICLVPHTSTTSFATDLSAGYWALIFDVGSSATSAALAEDWAVKVGAPVEGTDYSAKENAVGTTPGIGGSAKAWATTAHSTTVPGGGGEYSAKHYATEASTSASTATTQASTATTQAGLAAAALDSFDDRYLGAKAADPTLDNDGNALITGAIYWNTVGGIMKVWNGASWDATLALATPLAVAAGGTGATDASGARTALGLAIGTNVQAQDAELAAIAGLTSAANKGILFTGSGTASLIDITTTAQQLLDDTSAGDMLTTLGVSTYAKTLLDDTVAADARTTLGAIGTGQAVAIALIFGG